MKYYLLAGLAAVIVAFTGWYFGNTTDGPEITVYKSPTCGCCEKWVHHLEENGFKVKIEDVMNTAEIKNRFGVAPELEACHTGLVDGYVVEGHVPADVIRMFLKEKPKAKGLTVPGMPNGSPGMEGNGFKEPYNVYAFDGQGRVSVYARR